MQKRKRTRASTIARLAVLGVAVVLGLLLTFLQFEIPFNVGGRPYTFKSFTGGYNASSGIEIDGGAIAVYEVRNSSDSDDFSGKVDATVSRLESLLTNFTDASVVKQGSDRIRLELPGLEADDARQLMSAIAAPASMRFHHKGKDILSGGHFVSAKLTTDSAGVAVTLNSAGQRNFKAATADAATLENGIKVYQTVNGTETFIGTLTYDKEVTDGVIKITSSNPNFNASTLLEQINSGMFGVSLIEKEIDIIPAANGEDAALFGLIAGLVALALMLAFMGAVYRLMGAVSAVSMSIYLAVLFFFLMAVPGVQITIPAIVGVILGMAMAMGGNILIFEKIKEEYRIGRSIESSFKTGFKRSLAPILDCNITALVLFAILYFVGTGAVQGIAVVLIFSVIISALASLLLSRAVMRLFLNLNNTNAKLWGLKRGKGISEQDIPDEHEPKKSKETEQDAEDKTVRRGEVTLSAPASEG